MKRSFLLVVLAIASVAQAADDGVKAFLDGFVAKYSKAEIDFFYVSAARKGQHSDYVYIYWMTGNSILIVDVPTERLKDYYWYERKARIDLSSYVVPTADDIQGSTYLTDAAWVEVRLKECLNGGRKIIVKKKEPISERSASP